MQYNSRTSTYKTEEFYYFYNTLTCPYYSCFIFDVVSRLALLTCLYYICFIFDVVSRLALLTSSSYHRLNHAKITHIRSKRTWYFAILSLYCVMSHFAYGRCPPNSFYFFASSIKILPRLQLSHILEHCSHSAFTCPCGNTIGKTKPPGVLIP